MFITYAPFYIVNVPSPPLNVKTAVTSATTIKVTWSAPENPFGDIVGYRVYYFGSDMDKELEVSVVTMETVLTDLKKYEEYSIRVAAVNNNGIGISSDEVLARTFSDCKLLICTCGILCVWTRKDIVLCVKSEDNSSF